MARQTVVGGSGGGLLSKVIGLGVLIAVVIFVKDNPVHAADMFSSALDWAVSAVKALVRFLEHVSQ